MGISCLFRLPHFMFVMTTRHHVSYLIYTVTKTTREHAEPNLKHTKNDKIGALDSQARISRGTPDTKRYFRHQSSVRPVGSDPRLDAGSTVWCSNRDMPNDPPKIVHYIQIVILILFWCTAGHQDPANRARPICHKFM